jgi:hypothetical protein
MEGVQEYEEYEEFRSSGVQEFKEFKESGSGAFFNSKSAMSLVLPIAGS